MRWYSGARLDASLRLPSALVLVLVAAAMLPAGQTSAAAGQGTSGIEVRLCPQSGQSSMTLDLPVDGAILANDRVVVKGQAAKLADLEFYVSDEFRTTLDMGDSAVGYEQPLTLPPGMQTIKVVGYDICRRVVDTKSVSVSVPSPPSQVNAAPGISTVSSTFKKMTAAEIKAELPIVYRIETPNEGPLQTGMGTASPGRAKDARSPGASQDPGRSLLGKVADGLDLGATFRNLASVSRAMVAVAGVLLVIVPTAIVRPLFGVLNRIGGVATAGMLFLPWLKPAPKKGMPRRKAKSKVKNNQAMLYKRDIPLLRLVGIGLIVLLFIV